MTRSVLALLLLLAAPVAGQPGDDPPPPSSPPVPEALARLDAGDPAEAVALLEPYRDRPDTPDPVIALLGLTYLEADRPGPALDVLEPLAEIPEADPGVLYNAGRAALALGSVELAAGYLERSVRRAPESPAARELGLLLGAEGRYADALALLRPWVTRNPGDTEARLAAALCAIQLERPPDAEAMLEDLPEENPRGRLLSGKLALLQGDPYGAIEILESLVGSPSPQLDLDARRALADAYMTVGRASDAVQLLEDRAQAQPQTALQLSQALYQSGDLERAVEALRPFAEQLRHQEGGDEPGPMESLRASLSLEYGRLLVAAGQHAEAIPFLEIATRVRPEEKQGWQALGQALAAVGRVEEAQSALERFRDITHSEVPASVKDMQLERDVADPTGRELRGALRLMADDRAAEALELLERERRLAPEDPRPLLLESRALLQLDRPAEALEAVEAAADLVPESADVVYQRGAVEMALGRLEAAEASLRRALDLQPEHTASMNDLAVLLMERGDTDEARRLLERVLELRPDDPLAAANLEQLGG